MVNQTGGAGFEGYWHNAEAEASRVRNGWYWTGDLAYRDDDDFFYFAGRDFDWLRVDGENFAAAPIEGILQRHPDVVLASVYAVPDTVVGDQVMATVLLRRGSVVRPGGLRRLPGRRGRPGHQVGAPLRPGHRRAARDGHHQGAQAGAAQRGLALPRAGVVATGEGRPLPAPDRAPTPTTSTGRWPSGSRARGTANPGRAEQSGTGRVRAELGWVGRVTGAEAGDYSVVPPFTRQEAHVPDHGPRPDGSSAHRIERAWPYDARPVDSDARTAGPGPGRRRDGFRDPGERLPRLHAPGGPRLRSRARPSPRRSSRRPGWGWCGASSGSRAARRSRPGCSASWSTGLAPPAARSTADLPLTDAEPAVSTVAVHRRRCVGRAARAWETDADDRLVAGTWAEALRTALDELPPRQREIVILRDVEGLASEDVCAVLGVSQGNQRVLLHRGRSRLRSLLETELAVRGR